MRTYTRTWKVYGKDGHRQRVSFFPSVTYDWSKGDIIRIISLLCYDRTGTNDYCIVRITANNKLECEEDLIGQLYDGIFENSNFGKVEEIK